MLSVVCSSALTMHPPMQRRRLFIVLLSFVWVILKALMLPITILGIDPGTATTGYGVVVFTESGLELVSYGLISTKKDGEPADRLASIFDEMNMLFSRYNPHVMAIEKVFFASNAKTAIRVGQAQGVMLLAASHKRVPVHEYAPMTIKKMVTGSGKSDKKMVIKAVQDIFGAHVKAGKGGKTHFDNAADAVAIAMCHAMKQKENE